LSRPRERPWNEGRDIHIGGKLDPHVDSAVGGDLVAAVKDRANRESPSPQVGLAEPCDQEAQTLVVEGGNLLGRDVEERVLGHACFSRWLNRANLGPDRSPA
jgi:hypothetical protein